MSAIRLAGIVGLICLLIRLVISVIIFYKMSKKQKFDSTFRDVLEFIFVLLATWLSFISINNWIGE